MLGSFLGPGAKPRPGSQEELQGKCMGLSLAKSRESYGFPRR
jgi:hypothetical protein